MTLPRRRLEWATIALVSLGFVLWSAGFIHFSSFVASDGKRYFCLFDDAMVSMRYAWNLSHGQGLVWNPGERVEGYTNLLMTLWMAIATRLFDKSGAALAIQISGAAFMLGIAFVTRAIAGHLCGENERSGGICRVLAFTGALAYYPLAFWSLLGMETGLLALTMLLGVLFAFEYARGGSPSRLLAMTACFGLAYLTRNDSSIFAALAYAYLFWEARSEPGGRRKIALVLGGFALYLACVVGQVAFRWSYYGDWMPNTYTLKVAGMPLLVRLNNGIGYVSLFLQETALVLTLATMDVIFDFRRQKALLLAGVWSAVAYELYVGGDAFDYWRIMAPFMPLVILLFVGAVRNVVTVFANTRVFAEYFLRNPAVPGTEVVLVALTLWGVARMEMRYWPVIRLATKDYYVASNEGNVNAAIAIKEVTKDDASLGVFWAGAIPYFAGRRAVDFLGKADRRIARLRPDISGRIAWLGMTSAPGHNKYDLEYSIGTLRPTFVQGLKWGGQDVTTGVGAQYAWVEHRGTGLLLRKDSPAVLWKNVRPP